MTRRYGTKHHRTTIAARVRVFSTTLLVWEALVETRRKRVNVINTSLVSIYLTLLVAATAYSVYRIFDSQTTLVGFVYSGVILAFMVLLVFSVRQMFGAFERSYRAARELFGITPVDSPRLLMGTRIVYLLRLRHACGSCMATRAVAHLGDAILRRSD